MENSIWPQKESLLSDRSSSGHSSYSLPSLDVPDAPEIEEVLKRSKDAEIPELSELDVVRHFTRLSYFNYSIDSGMYPLGSCTMKYNPRINEFSGSHPQFLNLHPMTEPELIQGALEIYQELGTILGEISGFKHVSLQPAAGAQGEYAGVRMIRAYHEDRGLDLDVMLIPESAHGTNCATASMCGYRVVTLKCDERGMLTRKQIEEACERHPVAGLMITNPNTLGLFEEEIQEITDYLHQKNALVYCDGANLNAMLGLTRPGDAGVDVLHFNQHKTFTTPHGGGGPGCGAVGVSDLLEPYLSTPVLCSRKKDGNTELYFSSDRPKSIGPLKDFYGHFLMMLRSYTYVKELGAEGVRKVSHDAILLANYVRARLKDHYEIAYDRPCMHEVVFTDLKQKESGVSTLDIAKRLIDLGYHPPTVYFPLVVSGALMIEPTETESLDTVEHFCDVMIQIAEEAKEEGGFEKYFEGAPKLHSVAKIDETLAARELKLSWFEL